MEILASKDLNDTQKLLYGAILRLSHQHGYCYANNPHLAKMLGKSERTISRMLSDMVDKEMVFISNPKNAQRQIHILHLDTNVQLPRHKCLTTTTQMSNHLDTNVQHNKEYNREYNITTTTCDEDSISDEFFHGELKNVYLTDAHINKLECLIMNKSRLSEYIESLSKKIATGDEKKFNDGLPDAHFVRIEAYHNYRKKHPNKFKEAKSKKSMIDELFGG